MPEDIRIWEIIDGDRLREIKKAKLDLEENLENWLEKDISLVSSDLLVIGRQIATDFGGMIDLLCLDYSGNVVILELKREKTPREITAQVLDYASWVKDLSNEKISEIADRYLGDRGPLEDAFRGRFKAELPEILNENHKMLIVASEIDSSSERIVKYLSDSYGVGINAVTFQYFRDEDGKEYLARVFLIEPSQVEHSTKTKMASKRRPSLTYEELQEIAESNGVGELYRQLVEGLTTGLDQRMTTMSSVAFIGIMEGSRNTIFSLLPGESDPKQGIRFQAYIERLAEYLGANRHDVVRILPSESKEHEPWKGAPPTLVGFFKNSDEVDQFLEGFAELKQG